MRIFVNAAHHLRDSGVIYGPLKENVLGQTDWIPSLGMMVRDNLRPLLEGYEVFYVTDELDLKASIAWINEKCHETDFALEVHFNANNDKNIRGTEAYYADNPQFAIFFSAEVSGKLGIPNRGAKHDSQTYVGSLGFLRKLVCPSVVVEAAYLTNYQDRWIVSQLNAPRKIAEGVANAINLLFPLPKEVPPSWFRSFLLSLVSFLNNYLLGGFRK